MNVRKIFLILAGNSLYALAVTLFVLPNHLITGGTTGLALAFQHFFEIPIPLFVAFFNLCMFLLGLAALGKMFALTTVVSSFFYPLMLGQLERLLGNQTLTDDRLLASVFAGLIIGAAIGMVIRAGASTGGMDIPPLVLNKKYRISVSLSMYAFDCLILLMQILFSDAEQVLYGLLLILIYTVVLNKVLLIGTGQMQVKIISGEYEKIGDEIQTRMDRGITYFKVVKGYTKEDTCAVLAVVSGRELPRLNDLVMGIDHHAFMIINQVNEVKGRGFTLGKEYQG